MGRAVPPVKRIWGFGSTFEEWRPYRSDSDIDLAFEGGSTVDLEAALPGSEFHVSLVDLAEQDPAFASTVRSRSVLLYEKR
jgi:predicted nucleotidyltransferase